MPELCLCPVIVYEDDSDCGGGEMSVIVRSVFIS